MKFTGPQRHKALPLTEFNDLAEKKEAGPEFDYGVIDVLIEANSVLQAPAKYQGPHIAPCSHCPQDTEMRQRKKLYKVTTGTSSPWPDQITKPCRPSKGDIGHSL